MLEVVADVKWTECEANVIRLEPSGVSLKDYRNGI